MTTTATELHNVGKNTVTLHNGQTFSFKSHTSSDLDVIPIIDISRMYSDDIEDRKAVADEIRDAAHEIGFFYLINHGVDLALGDGVLEQAKRFFALPEEKKMEVYTGLVPNEYVGYHPMKHYNRNGWKHQDLSEAFNWAYSAAEDPEASSASNTRRHDPSIWPADLPGFRETLYAYHTPLLQFSRRLSRIFALSLGLSEDYFDAYTASPEAGMRILHYPPQAHAPSEQNGIGAHTDVEAFTIVTQDPSSSGLEILTKAGEWAKAKPVPGAFVVNIADCFMRQTNDFFRSTVHRVVNVGGKERYSAPFFFGWDRDVTLSVLPGCEGDGGEVKYPPMKAGDYYAWRVGRQKGGSGVDVAK